MQKNQHSKYRSIIKIKIYKEYFNLIQLIQHKVEEINTSVKVSVILTNHDLNEVTCTSPVA